MDLAANETSRREALGATSAGMGAVAWIATPWAPVGTPPSFGSIGHLFLLMPLVAAPLALDLLARLWTESGGGPSQLHGMAQKLQPVAAGLVLVSFCVPVGTAAGALALGWFGMALLVAVAGVTGAGHLGGVRSSWNFSLLAAQVFLPVGAVWLLLSRLGVGPRGLSPLTVSLAALHFHFNGFTSQILIGATGRALARASSRLTALHRFVTLLSIAGLPILAAGKVLSLPGVRIAGVGAIALGFIGLALTTMAVAVTSRSAATRYLLLASAASVAVAIALAGVYGVGEFAGRNWIGIGRMVVTHGVLMLGFTVCGLLGYARLQRA